MHVREYICRLPAYSALRDSLQCVKRWDPRPPLLKVQTGVRQIETVEQDWIFGDFAGEEPLGESRYEALPLIESLEPRRAGSPTLPNLTVAPKPKDHLGALATPALRQPERVLSVLSELSPMAAVGPVTLNDLLHVISDHLLEVGVPPPPQRYGAVFVGPVEAARGMSFQRMAGSRICRRSRRDTEDAGPVGEPMLHKLPFVRLKRLAADVTTVKLIPRSLWSHR